MAGEADLKRKLLWSYGIIAVLVAALAWSLLARGGSPAPEREADATTAAAPEDAATACLRLLNERRPQDAVPYCEEAAEDNPAVLSLKHNLGYAYRLAGDAEGSVRILEEVVAQDPLNVRSTYELAESYRAAGRGDRARETYSQVLQIDPSHGWAQRRLEELAN